MYNVIFELLNLLVFKLYLSHALFSCTVKFPLPPPLPTTSQGLVCRPMRGQELSGRLDAEHRSCRVVTPLGNLHVNAICMGGIQWTREVSIISSIEQASCMGVGKHYRCFEAGPSSMDPPSCSEWHLFLIQCSPLSCFCGSPDFYQNYTQTDLYILKQIWRLHNHMPLFGPMHCIKNKCHSEQDSESMEAGPASKHQ